MTPNSYVYLDYYQSADTDLEPEALGGDLPGEKVYSSEPTAGFSPEDQKYVIGAQANLWSEYIPTFSEVEYMIMPRIDAEADIQWSDPSEKDYQTFLHRVARMTQFCDRLGYSYGKRICAFSASLITATENGRLDLALTKFGEGDIYYTVDCGDPTYRQQSSINARYKSIKIANSTRSLPVRPVRAASSQKILLR
jgi:N-acetyl-beta-hexosaminidase